MPNAIATLQWDPQPAGENWSEVRIYENGVIVATAPSPATSITFSTNRSTHSWTARSFDPEQPAGFQESDDSNVKVVKPPAAPHLL